MPRASDFGGWHSSAYSPESEVGYTALGHTASLGARIEQIAEPGKAYLTEHTARLVEGMFALHDLGKLTVKGVKEPVWVYELQGVGRLRTRLEVSWARGFTKFVA